MSLPLRNSTTKNIAGYRPDIDGLRAVAVLLVVTFHAFPTFVPGGFLGVDIFFVISGYLVTGLLVAEAKVGNINIRAFYVRRIRRIFPALVPVLITSLIAGWFLLRASEFTQLAKHIVGGATFSSNIMLWRESGYFDNISETKPLLHLWSLGVEEQFYLVLPLLIFLSIRSKLKNGILKYIGFTALISFAYCQYLSLTDSTAAFYSPLSRVWELLAGSLLAVRIGQRTSSVHIPEKSRVSSVVKNSVAIALLILAVSFSEQGGATPGYWAVLPVVGTVLLISNNQRGTVGKVLSSRLLVSIGLISYPIYLWHWPILSFARITNGRELTTVTRVCCIAASFVLAALTTKLIESPIRHGYFRRYALTGLSIAMTLSAILASLVFFNDGFLSRPIEKQEVKFSGDVGHEDFHNYVEEHFHPCTPSWVYESALVWEGAVRCNQSKKDIPIEVILLGDSHAEHLFIGIAESLPTKNVGFYIRGVPPVRSEPEFKPLYDEVLGNSKIRVVIIAARWALRGVPVSETLSVIRELQGAGKTVYITDDGPRFSFDPSVCKFSGECTENRSVLDTAAIPYLADLETLIKSNSRLHFIRTSEYSCGPNVCSMSDTRKLLYRDFDHLNINGSRLFGQLILQDWPELSK